MSSEQSLPQAVTRSRKRFPLIWIVPLAATLIGGWIMAQALYTRGPLITITFHSAQGLEAGKTAIRYKDVEVGKVESITLSEDLTEVAVSARMQKGIKPYLTGGTRFWVERARVTASEVTGLETLLSGAYIGMEPGNGGEPVTTFKGEDVRPVVTTGLPGQHFILEADGLGSLAIRSPVYFHQIPVLGCLGDRRKGRLAGPRDRSRVVRQHPRRRDRLRDAEKHQAGGDARGERSLYPPPLPRSLSPGTLPPARLLPALL